MKIYIIRHGETDMNAKGVMQGRMNSKLNESGIKLAYLTGQAMKGISFDCCISSPLDRAMETAKIILKESGNDLPIEIDERLLEIDFGDMEGRKLSEMGEAGLLFYNDPFSFPGFNNGERIQDVCERTQDFLKELIKKDNGKTCFISTHGCAMRAMTNFLIENTDDFWCGHAPYNCSVTIIEAENGKPSLITMDKVYYDKSLIVDHYKKP